MTATPILATLDPIAERESDKLMLFIPAALAARCADCEGIFLAQSGKCPGCGSSSYVLDAREEVARHE